MPDRLDWSDAENADDETRQRYWRQRRHEVESEQRNADFNSALRARQNTYSHRYSSLKKAAKLCRILAVATAIGSYIFVATSMRDGEVGVLAGIVSAAACAGFWWVMAHCLAAFRDIAINSWWMADRLDDIAEKRLR